jgi:threonine dehydrogenase-like Zn-dependent dehydrogenase
MKARSVVQTADRTLETWFLEVPAALQPGEALLRVEGNGICGHDYSRWAGGHGNAWWTYPLPCGHEPVGRIERIGSEAARLWGVAEGDRVAVELLVSCHVCTWCRRGEMRRCANRFTYGLTGFVEGPTLSGGFGDYMVLRPNTIVHRLPDDLSVEDAVLYNPLGGAIDWVTTSGIERGDTVLIFGPGQRGLGAVVAAVERAAGTILVTGVASRDAHKFEVARRLGADHVIDVETEDVADRVDELTGGVGAQRVIDTAPGNVGTLVDAIRCVSRGGAVVIAGEKDNLPLPELKPMDLRKDFVIRAPSGAASAAYAEAIEIITSHRYPLELMHTHTFPLDEVERGIKLLGGEEHDGPVLHITIGP